MIEAMATAAGSDRDPAKIRDHLANERTFLAWVRTGVAMMGFGFVVARLRLELMPRPPGSLVGRSTLGVLFALVGIGVAIILNLAGYLPLPP